MFITVSNFGKLYLIQPVFKIHCHNNYQSIINSKSIRLWLFDYDYTVWSRDRRNRPLRCCVVAALRCGILQNALRCCVLRCGTLKNVLRVARCVLRDFKKCVALLRCCVAEFLYNDYVIKFWKLKIGPKLMFKNAVLHFSYLNIISSPEYSDYLSIKFCNKCEL